MPGWVPGRQTMGIPDGPRGKNKKKLVVNTRQIVILIKFIQACVHSKKVLSALVTDVLSVPKLSRNLIDQYNMFDA